jgi:FkbM family methyltransferase
MISYLGEEKDPNHKYQEELGKQLYNEIIYEDSYQIREIFKKCTRNIDTIIDIGSNIGYFTLISSILYPHAKKILVEPNPENVKVLNKNFKDFSNINIIPKALGNGSKVKMNFDERWSGSDSVVYDDNGNIETIGIVDIIPKDAGNFILKIDCEGGEKYLLDSNPELFKNCIYFVSEFHENENNNIVEWENWIKKTFSKNYKVIKKFLGKDMQNNLYIFLAYCTLKV